MRLTRAAVFAISLACTTLACTAHRAPQPVSSQAPPRSTASAPSPTATPGLTRTRIAEDDNLDFGPNAISFISSTHGWALTPCAGTPQCGRLFETTDAGGQWTALGRPDLPSAARLAVREGAVDLYFADARNGYLFTSDHCATDCLSLTRDGGRTWTVLPLPPVAQLFTVGATSYAVTETAFGKPVGLLTTRVGSARWRRRALPVDDGVVGLAVARATIAVLQTASPYQDDTPSARGRIWVSEDGGLHWSAEQVPCHGDDGGAAALAMSADDPSVLTVDCYDNEQSSQEQRTQHHIYRSSDAGQGWNQVADPTDVGAPIALVDNGAGHVVLATGSGIRSLLVMSTDGGRRWRVALALPTVGFAWGNLRFVSRSTGFVLAPSHYAAEHIYRTTDGGRDWSTLPVPPSP